MPRTPNRRKRLKFNVNFSLTRPPLKSKSFLLEEEEDRVTIDTFSDDENPYILTPARTNSGKRNSKSKSRVKDQVHFDLDDDDSYLIENASPVKLSPEKGERIEAFDSPKRPRKKQFASLISSFPSPDKTPDTPSFLTTFRRSSFGSKRVQKIVDDEEEDLSIIERIDEPPTLKFEPDCTISSSFSPIKIDLKVAALKKDQSTFSGCRKPPRLPRRKKIGGLTNATPSTCATQSSISFQSNFVKLVYKKLNKYSLELEYERLKLSQLSDEEKAKQKCVFLQILTIVTDQNISVIEGEVINSEGFDGSDNDETDLLIKRSRIILPRTWSEGMGLSRFTILRLFYPLNISRTGDDRLLLDNIFWIQVEERAQDQAMAEPQEKPIHEWDCLCQVSSKRIIPVCNPTECSKRLATVKEAKRLALKAIQN